MEVKIRDRRMPSFTWHPNTLFDDGHVARMGDGFVIYAALIRLAQADAGKPTAEAIAKLCGTNETVVVQRLERLTRLGYLERTREGDDDHAAIYRIIEPADHSDLPTEGAEKPAVIAMKAPRPKLDERTDRIGLLIKYFRDAWRKRYPGSDCFWQFGKHDKMLKTILAACDGDDRYRAVVDAYFKSTDEFVLKEGHSLEILQAKLNKFLSQSRAAKPVAQVNRPNTILF